MRSHWAVAIAAAGAAWLWGGLAISQPAVAPAASAAASTVATAAAVVAVKPPAGLAPPRVPQPIDFPHWRHAGAQAEGGMEINCLYCHTYARRSTVAGIPPLAKCMGCHRHVATDKPEIQKLTDYWRRGEPVPWKKVHDLPEFVYFSHERHVQRFVFQQGQPVQQACGYCHGDVKRMGVAEKQRKLTMGWCLSCHKQFQHPDAEAPAPTAAWVVAPSDRPLTVPTGGKHDAAHRTAAPRDCVQCHK